MSEVNAAAGAAVVASGEASESASASALRLLLFVLDGRLYGCDISAVREVVTFRRATRLPGAPPYVCGLVNLRGTLVTVLDLGLRIGSKAVDRTDGSVILVDHGGRLVGLGVDEVRDVQPVSADQIEAATDEASGGIVRGLAHVGEAVVVLLDVREIVRQVLL